MISLNHYGEQNTEQIINDYITKKMIFFYFKTNNRRDECLETNAFSTLLSSFVLKICVYLM